MSHLNTSFEPDIDSFLNLDQAEYTPATTSSNTQTPALAHASSSSSYFASSSTPQTFSGPSFQYDAYRQQTGLPVGGLANTFAINQASGLQQYDGQGGFVMPNETINLPLSKIEDLDFNRPFDFNDMDFEDDSPSDLPTIFYPSSSSSQFVSPTNLVSSDTSPSISTPIQRIYPGMHSQAAQAKAQQAQQKQQELIRQQQQPRQIPGQKPLPKTPAAKDPQVEESISRILSQMRQKSVSSVDDDAAMSSISSVPRIKKDEDDMDEDERLLASEEGKKLSSKERRQLRNKVSARAFRSRRKGKHKHFHRV
jgi:bZIP-type transcription factor MBZ1